MTLTLVGGHEHDWKRYVLIQDSFWADDARKVYTQKAVEDVPGAYYTGYECGDCGVDGYGL